MKQFIEKEMYKDKERQNLWFKFFMTPLALVFGLLGIVRQRIYKLGVLKPSRFNEPVVSIGNLSVGGTGKSPLIVALAAALKGQGIAPVVLSRGYKSGLQAGQSACLLNGEVVFKSGDFSDPTADEARMQSAQLADVPVVIGADRVGAARAFRSFWGSTIDMWLLDDGFQHCKVHKDLDIVLLDASNPFGSFWCLPRGFLRETVRALKRADLLLFSGCTSVHPSAEHAKLAEEVSGLQAMKMSVTEQEPYLISGSENMKSLDQGVSVVCGIARPTRLIDSVQRLDLTVKYSLLMNDHELISRELIEKQCSTEYPILTTEKDYWRQKEMFESLPHTVYVLPIHLTFNSNDKEKIVEHCLKLLKT